MPETATATALADYSRGRGYEATPLSAAEFEDAKDAYGAFYDTLRGTLTPEPPSSETLDEELAVGLKKIRDVAAHLQLSSDLTDYLVRDLVASYVDARLREAMRGVFPMGQTSWWGLLTRSGDRERRRKTRWGKWSFRRGRS